MLNYKNCPIEEFEAAMLEKNSDPSTISDEHLYILYTKFKADAATCANAKTGYATGLSISSEQKAESYKIELQNRGIII